MIYISTNMYPNEHFEEVFQIIDQEPNLGIEIFPQWNRREFEEILRRNEDRLKQIPITFHEQYYEAENSFSNRDIRFQKTMEFQRLTLKWAKRLNSKYIVYHYNNCEVIKEQKKEMVRNARENLLHLSDLAKTARTEIVVENTGIQALNNVLLNEEEFIRECRQNQNKVLIDIGHAWCNRWDLEHVIESLKDKIIAYHIHNNDGVYDRHQRIHNGSFDFDEFGRLYSKYTNKADLVIEYVNDVYLDYEGIIEDIKYLTESEDFGIIKR